MVIGTGKPDPTSGFRFDFPLHDDGKARGNIEQGDMWLEPLL
jgi:hypothetical protein